MGALARVGAEAGAAWRSFVRRRTAVFFTFFFPVILIVIFGALVRTDPTGAGLFTEPAGYYVPGYLAVVVLFTPLSRVGSTVARHREGNRFEKLATTPLTRAEWLAAHTLVNAVIIGIASALLLGVIALITDAEFALSPWLVPLVALGVALFCGIGAMLGRAADSQDGVVAASNTIALPMLFLAETFVTPDLLPSYALPLIDLLPLTYFSRGVRAATFSGASPATDTAILAALALVSFVVGAYAIPRTD
ncbi:ABC transporter permease [Halostella sp. JP-L12]|uniref:ABC transporter permease n=1 Tax=Halostella TaxID=1843185 RepID=UPI000EF7E1A3|nr:MULTISPECIES: ABC transporter permease [Halostella]NHN49918.1 ABC transporter permease [Halostella sp. JP-L12]